MSPTPAFAYRFWLAASYLTPSAWLYMRTSCTGQTGSPRAFRALTSSPAWADTRWPKTWRTSWTFTCSTDYARQVSVRPRATAGIGRWHISQCFASALRCIGSEMNEKHMFNITNIGLKFTISIALLGRRLIIQCLAYIIPCISIWAHEHHFIHT